MRNPPQLPADPFGRTARPAATMTRRERLALVREYFTASFEGREPSTEARLFTAGGALAWMQRGGSLTRDFWRIDAPPGSHLTAAELARRLARDEATEDDIDEDGSNARPERLIGQERQP